MAISEWSIGIVQELLVRQFINGEDVSAIIPPPPECNPQNYMFAYDAVSRIMMSYVRNGPPPAPLNVQSVNIVGGPQQLLKPSPMTTPVKTLPNGNIRPPPSSLMPPKTPTNRVPGNENAKPGTYQPSSSSGLPQSAKTPTAKSGTSGATLRDVVPPPAPYVVPGSAAVQATTVPQSMFPSAVPAEYPASQNSASLITKRERPVVDPTSPKGGKKNRIEWPIDVPTNTMLKNKSRSAVAHLTTERVKAQQTFDPDMIFQQPKGELPLHTIFADHPKALKAVSALRGTSGDWNEDTFTADEERQYKQDIGLMYVGPSQCAASILLQSGDAET